MYAIPPPDLWGRDSGWRSTTTKFNTRGKDVVADALSRLHLLRIREDKPVKLNIRIKKRTPTSLEQLDDELTEIEEIQSDSDILYESYNAWKTDPTKGKLIKLCPNKPDHTQITYQQLRPYNETKE